MLIGISGKIGSGKDTVGKIIQYLTSYTNIVTSQHSGSMSFNFFNSIYKDLEQDWEIKKFADTLKDMTCLLLNCTREQLEDREYKERELGEEWMYYKATGFPNEGTIYDYRTNKEKGASNYYELVKPTPRLLLQLLGTECGRNILHPNVWANAFFAKYAPLDDTLRASMGNVIDYSDCPFPNWIVTDVRFPNELEAIKNRRGISIRVNRRCKSCGYTIACEDSHNIGCDEATDGFLHESEIALDYAKFDYTVDNSGSIEELVEKIKEILIKENLI